MNDSKTGHINESVEARGAALGLANLWSSSSTTPTLNPIIHNINHSNNDGDDDNRSSVSHSRLDDLLFRAQQLPENSSSTADFNKSNTCSRGSEFSLHPYQQMVNHHGAPHGLHNNRKSIPYIPTPSNFLHGTGREFNQFPEERIQNHSRNSHEQTMANLNSLQSLMNQNQKESLQSNMLYSKRSTTPTFSTPQQDKQTRDVSEKSFDESEDRDSSSSSSNNNNNNNSGNNNELSKGIKQTLKENEDYEKLLASKESLEKAAAQNSMQSSKQVQKSQIPAVSMISSKSSTTSSSTGQGEGLTAPTAFQNTIMFELD